VYSFLRTNPPIDYARRMVEEEQEYLRDDMPPEDLP
jgi:hypothetical protein